MGDTLTLKDGTPGWVWPLLPTHRESLVKAFEDLSPESRRLRFLTPVERLSDSMLHQLVDEVDGVDHIALVVFVETETEALPIAIGRIVRYPDIHDAADIAVTVRDDWQGRGVATALLSLLVARRPVDVTRIITEVAMDNPASLAMLRHLGPMRLHDTGMGIFDVEINLEATAPSVMPEQPVTGERLHPVLERPGREILRNRDLVCGWLSASTGDAPESTTGPAQSEEGIDPEALDKTI
ncbi:MAG: GNAT family N-acetyltransferase [Marmoricola sp.]